MNQTSVGAGSRLLRSLHSQNQILSLRASSLAPLLWVFTHATLGLKQKNRLSHSGSGSGERREWWGLWATYIKSFILVLSPVVC